MAENGCRADPHGRLRVELDELRAVARYGAECAQEVLTLFEEANPGIVRAAIEAAPSFANGGARTYESPHRMRTEPRRCDHRSRPIAADAAGDAAAAAYLHPLAKATQVGHILGRLEPAHAAELSNENDLSVEVLIEQAQPATPMVIEVLRRYPLAPVGTSRVAHLMTNLTTRCSAMMQLLPGLSGHRIAVFTCHRCSLTPRSNGEETGRCGPEGATCPEAEQPSPQS